MASLLVLVKKIIIYLIRIYQFGISPVLGNRCRFSMTCSQYGIRSIHRFGVLKGGWKTCLRILHCHPLAINSKNFCFLNVVNMRDVLSMSSKLNFFIITFLIISLILWQIWETEYSKIVNSSILEQSYNHQNDNNNNSSSYILKKKIANHQCITTDDNQFITIKTDVFLLKINLYGGNIEEVYLVKYLEDLVSKKPLLLLQNSKNFKYQINSWLINECTSNNLDQNQKLLYHDLFNKHEYIMSDYENELQITLIHTDSNGITYKKRYVFDKKNYSVHLYHIINNMSLYPINIKLFGNLIQTITCPANAHTNGTSNDEDNFPISSYRGAAYSTDKEKYQKCSFKDIKRVDLNINTNTGWIAMLQKYFVTAWLPITPKNNTFYTHYIDKENASIGFKSNSVYVPIGKTVELESILWIGPKIQDSMKLVAPNLDLVIDYGWLWFISQPLFKLLQFIYHYINNWGLSIILITLIIRLIMYPLTKAQYISMAKIRTLQPKLTIIQEQYKHDRYQYHQKTIELYKKEKVNPLGGCLPLIIQMPIFLALYYMLSSSVELRHAKFIFWINDLSAPDPWYILPVIMGMTMFFLQKLSPNTITDSMQKKVMSVMLIVFTVFFLWFPSGLVLYYIVSNIITIVQQQMIYYGLHKKSVI